jgi:hypothetical protein
MFASWKQGPGLETKFRALRITTPAQLHATATPPQRNDFDPPFKETATKL